ncbi:hypothetical protein [Chenggangzhangella methanolivorans]|uniref:Uncharacterized protein n=1 Tax=Chenggangzhangella methanolivorans TaxID=1437009 RepID=A0A9E6R981_9HYPH|nr:hypothetical protein [Chenggangzhangella methanolivorans]QZN99153.1 hypothetical protein K6K41_20280 [Chenggangzhangella methanolivorans]
MGVRLTIESDGNQLFEISGSNALAPMNEGERAIVFGVLMDALSILAGITPPKSSCATEAVTDGYSEAIEQCQTGHSSGTVVRLARRHGTQVRPATP